MAAIPRNESPVPEPPIRTLEMVRTIRDAFYERTRGMSREEFRAFIAREAAGTQPGEAAPTERPDSA